MENITDFVKNFQYNTIYSILIPLLYTLGLGGIFGSIVYLIWYYLVEYLKKQLISTISIESSEPMFEWVMSYLSEKGLIGKSMNNLKLSISDEKKEWWMPDQELEKSKIKFTPGSGYHSFIYEGVRVFVSHVEGNPMTVGFERRPMKPQTIFLYAYGTRKIKILKKICEESYQHIINKDRENVNIYSKHEWWSSWTKIQSKPPRKIETVVLDSTISEEIKKDIEIFMESEKWYRKTGVPYRRGYLLHGPPGTGKTSFITAIAGVLKLNICPLNLSGGNLDDDELAKLLENCPIKSIILLEDIDAIFADRISVGENSRRRSVSFSGLLNALDGVRSQEGRILFMTTNHKEKLDPALLRPGRADVHIMLNYASALQIKKFYLKFFPGEFENAEKFTQVVPENVLSMAKLQGHFLHYRNNASLAIEKAGELLENDNYSSQSEMTIGEWLHRLNLHCYIKNFHQSKIYRISELKNVNEDVIRGMNIKIFTHIKRMAGMIEGEKDVKRAFQWMSKNSARSILINMTENSSEEIENIVNLIPDGVITEHQLKDTIDDEELLEVSIIERIKRLLKINVNFENNLKASKSSGKIAVNYEKLDKENLLKKKQPIFEFDIKEVLKSIGFESCFEKLKLHKVDSVDAFLNLTDELLESLLEIKVFGDKQVFSNKIKALKEQKEKFDKEMKEKSENTINYYYATREEGIEEKEEELIEQIPMKKEKSISY